MPFVPFGRVVRFPTSWWLVTPAAVQRRLLLTFSVSAHVPPSQLHSDLVNTAVMRAVVKRGASTTAVGRGMVAHTATAGVALRSGMDAIRGAADFVHRVVNGDAVAAAMETRASLPRDAVDHVCTATDSHVVRQGHVTTATTVAIVRVDFTAATERFVIVESHGGAS